LIKLPFPIPTGSSRESIYEKERKSHSPAVDDGVIETVDPVTSGHGA
jgi:hypothetical protein